MDGNAIKTLIFMNYLNRNPNLELLKEFHRKTGSIVDW
jgi:hypothetical protein